MGFSEILQKKSQTKNIQAIKKISKNLSSLYYMLADLDFLHIVPVLVRIVPNRCWWKIFFFIFRGKHVKYNTFDISKEDFTFIFVVISGIDSSIPIDDPVF